MSLVPILYRKRKNWRRFQQRNPIHLLGLSCSIFIALIISLLLIGTAVLFANLTTNLPSLELFPLLLDPFNGLLLQPTKLYDRTGQNVIFSLVNPAAPERQYAYLDSSKNPHLPENLVYATLTSIDPTFWENPGYSRVGLREGEHPTLAQKLVFDLVINEEPSGLRRNFRERLLAAQLISRFGREKVLEWYLNQKEYGKWIYGANAASQVYFAKPASELNLSEAAFLAAVAEVPGLNPSDAPMIVLDRQKAILQDMFIHGWISEDEWFQADQEKLVFQATTALEDSNSTFTNLVLEQLEPFISTGRLEHGGFRIITTMDMDLQHQADCATNIQLSRINNLDSLGDPKTCPSAQLLPTLPFQIKGETGELVASVVIYDPKMGQILSMFGSSQPGLDPAHLPGHPPGTILTPFIYLTAFTRGFSPATLLWDIPGDKEMTVAELKSENQYHGPVRLRTAFANDYLEPAHQLLMQFGVENIIRTTNQIGILSLDNIDTSGQTIPQYEWLNTGQVTLLELTKAFGIFANEGISAGRNLGNDPYLDTSVLSPTTVLRLEDNLGRVWLDWSTPEHKSLLSSPLSYLVVHILSDESARWPSMGHPNPLEIGRPAGAKVGSTYDGKNVWTIGFTPQYVVGVWMGKVRGEENPISPILPATLWHALIQYTVHDLPSEGWDIPSGISTIDVCDPSGMLSTIYCPTIIPEVFITGSEPTQYDNLYRPFQINRETGRLATVFTPPELIEERVFMVVPANAMDWAKAIGLPTAPDTYDVIYAPLQENPNVQIQTPRIFSHVSGRVTFTGSAAGEEFAYYRIQIGQGLNPSQWLQIGEDINKPVQNNVLGEWNTTGLEGLFTVQLLVVRQDQQVERFTTQLTVDNQPPEVTILHPIEGQSFPAHSTVILHIKASDDLELKEVQFYIDDHIVGSLSQPPFTLPWSSKSGKHTLLVKVIDLAGNSSEDSLIFEILK